jgi:hypothetical protein
MVLDHDGRFVGSLSGDLVRAMLPSLRNVTAVGGTASPMHSSFSGRGAPATPSVVLVVRDMATVRSTDGSPRRAIVMIDREIEGFPWSTTKNPRGHAVPTRSAEGDLPF